MRKMELDMKIPKYLRHESIQDIEDLTEQSCGAYKWSVLLKRGWCWGAGHTKGARSLNLNNKADFEYANPTRVE